MQLSAQNSSNNQSMAEIVFFDVETTVPNGTGRRFWVVEFGAITVCPRKLVEVDRYCTLIRPGDLSAVAQRSGRSNGITRQTVASAPKFEDVANKIFEILNGRIWAGHNIQRFDCARIREAFADIGRPAPKPIGIIDSLSVLTHQFGRRAGNLKMATLAAYFGLGQQKHRSLDDVKMNLEVFKHCATVLLLVTHPSTIFSNESSIEIFRKMALNRQPIRTRDEKRKESSLPQMLPGKSVGCSSVVTRSRANARSCGEEAGRKTPPTSPATSHRVVPYSKKDKLMGKVMEGAKDVLRRTRSNQPLTSLFKHSRSLLR